MKYSFLIILIFLISSCNQAPVPVKLGEEECEHCRMVISDAKFVGELITDKGKIYKFDSIECLAEYYSKTEKNNLHSAWVSNYFNENQFLNVSKANFHISNINSPMGLNLLAFSEKKELNKLGDKNGKTLNWKSVVEYVQKSWN